MAGFAARGLAVLLLAFAPSGLARGAAATPPGEQDDPDVPAYAIVVSSDGSSLVVSGGVRFGLERDIEKALDASPAIRTIVLDSPGGRLGSAEEVARLIKQRGLDTYVPQACLSACTRIFVAGRHRTLREGAKLGFHGAALSEPAPATGMLLWLANQLTVTEYVGDGISRDFMQRAVGVAPPSIWYPTDQELMGAHVVTVVMRAIPLPPAPVRPPPVPPRP